MRIVYSIEKILAYISRTLRDILIGEVLRSTKNNGRNVGVTRYIYLVRLVTKHAKYICLAYLVDEYTKHGFPISI